MGVAQIFRTRSPGAAPTDNPKSQSGANWPFDWGLITARQEAEVLIPRIGKSALCDFSRRSNRSAEYCSPIRYFRRRAALAEVQIAVLTGSSSAGAVTQPPCSIRLVYVADQTLGLAYQRRGDLLGDGGVQHVGFLVAEVKKPKCLERPSADQSGATRKIYTLTVGSFGGGRLWRRRQSPFCHVVKMLFGLSLGATSTEVAG